MFWLRTMHTLPLLLFLLLSVACFVDLQIWWNKIFLFADAVFFVGSWSRGPSRAASVPPPISSPPFRSLSVQPRDLRASSLPRYDPLSPLDLLSEYEREPFERALSPTPVKCGRWGPRNTEVAFDSDGNLIILRYRHPFFVWNWFFSCETLWIYRYIKAKPNSRVQLKGFLRACASVKCLKSLKNFSSHLIAFFSK